LKSGSEVDKSIYSTVAEKQTSTENWKCLIASESVSQLAKMMIKWSMRARTRAFKLWVPQLSLH